MQIVTCVCGQQNRVPYLGPGRSARCGKCRTALNVGWQPNPVIWSVDDEDDDEDEDDEDEDDD